MKEWKFEIVKKMEENAKELHSVTLRKAALECGKKHICVEDAKTIIRSFLNRNKEYAEFMMGEEKSYFTGVFVTDNGTYPHDDRLWICERG